MNYLAHAYLSFGNEEVLLGNMMSDYIKGKKQFLYPPVIHNGIVLHRMIDAFTDAHPATQKAKEVFKGAYRLYSGAFVDVAYDHFLATDANEFSKESLNHFSKKTYEALSRQQQHMPDVYKKVFFYMRTQNWLYGYYTRRGIHQSFGGLVKRAAYLQDSAPAIDLFEKNYTRLAECYQVFWKDVKPYALQKMKELLKQ